MSPKNLNILLLVVSVFLYFSVVKPLYSGTTSVLFKDGQSFKSLIEKRNAYDLAIEEVPKLIKQAKEYEELYNNISEEDRKKILTMVPVSVNEIKLMSELVNIGNKADSFPIENMGIKDKQGKYSVNFSVTTTYANFDKIIKVWESSMRLFSLESVSFTPGKTEEEAIKFNVDFFTYYMK